MPSCIRPIRLRTSFWRSSFAIDPLPPTARCLQAPTAGERVDMLRKAMWTGLYAGLGAASTMITRRLATKIWRVATGEDPPAKR